jgi:hypothetical protein
MNLTSVTTGFLNGPAAPGNLLVAEIIFSGTTAQVVSITDDAGDTLKQAYLHRFSDTAASFYAVTAGASSVTFTLDQIPDNGGGQHGINLTLFEYTGLQEAGDVAYNSGPAGVALTAGPIATTVPNSLVLAYAFSSSLPGDFTGFMTRSHCSADLMGDQLEATPGMYSAAYSALAPDVWSMTMVVFQPASDAGFDGGTDAGAMDAGAMDAGADAGSGSEPDAGAGPAGPRLVQVGLGCEATKMGIAEALTLALLLLAFRRRPSSRA